MPYRLQGPDLYYSSPGSTSRVTLVKLLKLIFLIYEIKLNGWINNLWHSSMRLPIQALKIFKIKMFLNDPLKGERWKKGFYRHAVSNYRFERLFSETVLKSVLSDCWKLIAECKWQDHRIILPSQQLPVRHPSR